MFKIIFVCALVVIVQTEAFVRRDVPSTSGPNILESLQKNFDDFRKCLDQSLARTTSDVNVKTLQPAFAVVGDSVNRVSKAFDDLTTPPKRSHNYE